LVLNFGYWHLSGRLSSGSAAFNGAANQHHLKNEVNSLAYGCRRHNTQKAAARLATGVPDLARQFHERKKILYLIMRTVHVL